MGNHDDRLRLIRLAYVVVHDPHVFHHRLPTIPVGEITALARGKTVAAMVVSEHGVAPPGGGSRESLIAHDVFTESMQQLDDADRVSLGRPGLHVNLVPVLDREDDFFVVSFVHGRRVSGREIAARPSINNSASLTSSSVE